MADRETFERLLRENPDDPQIPAVFADWLLDQDEYEYEDRMRKWPAARAWMEKFAQNFRTRYGDETGSTIAELLDIGRSVELASDGSGDTWFRAYSGNNESIGDVFRGTEPDGRSTAAAFWEHWQVLTGEPLPAGVTPEAEVFFKCAC